MRLLTGPARWRLRRAVRFPPATPSSSVPESRAPVTPLLYVVARRPKCDVDAGPLQSLLRAAAEVDVVLADKEAPVRRRDIDRPLPMGVSSDAATTCI